MFSNAAFLFLVTLTVGYLFLAAVILVRLLWGPSIQKDTHRDSGTGAS